MDNYLIFGPDDRDGVVRQGIFRDIADGRLANARYYGLREMYPEDFFNRPSFFWRVIRKSRKLLRSASLLGGLQLRFIDDRGMRVDFSGEGRTVFLFCVGSHLHLLPTQFVRRLRRKHPGSRMLLYVDDGVDLILMRRGISLRELFRYFRAFDAVYSYNQIDVEKYGNCMRYVDIPVWHSGERAPAVPEADLYYCGRERNRSALISSIYRRCAAEGLRFRSRISTFLCGVPEGLPGIEPSEWVPYAQTVSELLRSNCILELVDEYSHEATLRYKEAVIYNKKLLTNNPNIASLPYCDPRWMRVFRTAEDIDLDWVRAVEPVDYGYRGEFTVERFFQRIEELEGAEAQRR